MKRFLKFAASAALVALLAACGGGGSNSGGGGVTGVRVFGDSLADSGVFGFKFTVNAAGSAAGVTPTATPIWPEIIAGAYSKQLCNYFNFVGSAFTAPTAACTSYAVGGGRINNFDAATGAGSSPFSIPFQMDAAASAVGGTFTTGELMLVDGGGNDAADLVGAYLGAASGAAGQTTYVNLLSTILPIGSVTATIGTTGGAETLAGQYMAGVANKYADAINTKLLARGATRVVVLNAPAVTNTPRFKLVLQSVAAGPAGAAGAAQVESLVRSWTVAFNTQLNTRLGSESRVALVDFYTVFNNQVSQPASFGITNVTTPACPVVGTDSQGLPNYSFPTCTAAALDASGPATWRTYAFSDGFHPTPLGHRLLSDTVSAALTQKGWR